jgi:hemolysin activation/secretion protein
MSTRRRYIAVLRVSGTLLVGIGSPAFSQSPPDAGRLLEDSRRDGTLLPPRRDALPGGAEPVRPALKAPDSFKVRVSGFRISGLTAISEEEVRAVLVPFTGKELGLEELEAAADAVTRLYRSKGFFLARAYLPQQDIRDGSVEIAVLEGRLGQVSVKTVGSVRLRQGVAERMIAARQQTGSLVEEQGLERSLLLLNDLPGITAESTLGPGATVGTTNLAVEISEGPLVTGSAELDNYGNRFTGEARLGGQVNLLDPSGYGDAATLRAQASRGLESVRGAYTLPIGADGFSLSASGSTLRYELCCDFAPLRAKGTAREFGLNASYPLIRNRSGNLYLSGGYAAKTLFNETVAGTTSDKTVRNFSLGISGDRRDAFGGGGLNSASASVTFGKANLDGFAPDRAVDDATARTQGAFSKLNYTLARVQRLSDSVNLFVHLSGQLASKNLDSAEKFSLGGPYGVRGYPTGEAVGDEGQLLNAELRWEFMPRWQLAGIIDHGRIRLHRNEWANWQGGNTILRNQYSLSSAGLTLSYTRPGDFTVRAIWAHKLGANAGRNPASGNDADSRDQRNRLWLQAVKQF